MEGSSPIFFPSTNNSATSSSTNFPFSLNHFSSNSNDFVKVFDDDDDHHQELKVHHQNEPLISGMMMGHQQQRRPVMDSPMVQFQTASFNNYHISDNNGHVSSHDVEHQDYVDKQDVSICNNNQLKKKGSTEKKKIIGKHRYAFKTRSQVDILDDGYRWRKYGQKAVKNNKFSRSYYRCTYQGCNVRKQVQRLSEDEGIVVTTYDGIHSHSVEKSIDNFEHILSHMQIYTSS